MRRKKPGDDAPAYAVVVTLVETAKARLVRKPWPDDGKMWLPKSLHIVEYEEDGEGGRQIISMPRWLAEERGLTYADEPDELQTREWLEACKCP